jgi:hypothetical protein
MTCFLNRLSGQSFPKILESSTWRSCVRVCVLWHNKSVHHCTCQGKLQANAARRRTATEEESSCLISEECLMFVARNTCTSARHVTVFHADSCSYPRQSLAQFEPALPALSPRAHRYSTCGRVRSWAILLFHVPATFTVVQIIHLLRPSHTDCSWVMCMHSAHLRTVWCGVSVEYTCPRRYAETSWSV